MPMKLARLGYNNMHGTIKYKNKWLILFMSLCGVTTTNFFVAPKVGRDCSTEGMIRDGRRRLLPEFWQAGQGSFALLLHAGFTG